jgi:hypothetical protein
VSMMKEFIDRLCPSLSCGRRRRATSWQHLGGHTCQRLGLDFQPPAAEYAFELGSTRLTHHLAVLLST